MAGGAYPPFFYNLIYGTRRSRLYPTDTDEQLYEHLQQLDLQPVLQSYPNFPHTGLTLTSHQSTTPSVSGLRSDLLPSPHLGQTLMLGSLESGLGARHRRCSSPSSFLHMIREDVSDCVGGDDLWPGVIDHKLRKTSLGLDDSSPVGGEWSRKTSSTSGYSEMTDGLRKLSAASEEERLSTYSCSSRKASGASEEEEQAEWFLKGSDRVSKSKGRRSTDEGIAMVGEDVIQCGTNEDDIAGDKLVPMESIPAFQFVIHKADSEDSQNASSLLE